MMTPEFITFHGSPGTPYDFEPLRRAICQYEWKGFIRYKESMPIPSHSKTSFPVAVGYSYGCSEAMLAASRNEEIKALVLIAPYAFTASSSILKKALVALPGIGNLILKRKGSEIISDLLTKSSYPSEVPQIYKSYGEHLLNPLLLKAAVWEKKDRKAELLSACEILNKRGIPILILWGIEDQTGVYEEQVGPLEKALENVIIKKLNKAGHALPYTHYIDVAKTIGSFLKEEIKKISITQKVKDSQKKESEKYDFLNTDHKFGYYEGEHQLNNVASFLYHHLNLNRNQEILTWVHPNRFEYWEKSLSSPLPHDSINVEDLDLLVGKIASGLKILGLKKNDKVIIFIPMSLYLYAAMFAVQKIGAVAVFLDSWARRDQMGAAVDVVSPKAIISVEKAFDYLKEVESISKIPLKIVAGAHTGTYSKTLEDLMGTDNYAEAEAVESEHTALITFTTGSSGTPKGADRTHRFLAAQHYALNRHLPYQSGDADLPAFPIFSLNNLAAGVKTVIPAFDVGSPGENDALILLKQFEETLTTATTLSPSLLRALYNYCLAQEIKLPNLKRVVTGGAPVSNDDVRAMKKVAPNAEVLVLYGSTEVEPMAHIEAEEMLKDDFKDTDSRLVPDGVNVGKFDSGLAVKYIKIFDGPISIGKESDWENFEVKKGEVGEIIVSGEHVCEKYFNNSDATLKTKIKDNQNRIWHRTGDLGRCDQDNNLWLVGRVHNAISRNGTYLFPVRAEFVLKKSERIKKAAFLGIPDTEFGERTVAVYSLKEEFMDKKTEVEKEAKELLEYNGIIFDQLLCVEDIPMDPRHHSKVEYGVLREYLKDQALI
ncbi:MAG: AMP-binding protein [Bacteriovoracaceae bacterium]|nr:AMP-binding protein [Bacteriovoracaceae bacterium]